MRTHFTAVKKRFPIIISVVVVLVVIIVLPYASVVVVAQVSKCHNDLAKNEKLHLYRGVFSNRAIVYLAEAIVSHKCPWLGQYNEKCTRDRW